MPNSPPPTPAERFATLLRWLGQAVAARSAFGLSLPLIALIVGRLRGINQCVARLAARIRDGKYVPRRFAPRRPPADARRRQPNKLPQNSGWLLKLVPEAVAYRSQLEFLFGDAEMAALLAAAPASLARPLRSLCHMLRVTPPPILAPPRPAPRNASAATEPEPPPMPPPTLRPSRSAAAPTPPLTSARGPPLPA